MPPLVPPHPQSPQSEESGNFAVLHIPNLQSKSLSSPAASILREKEIGFKDKVQDILIQNPSRQHAIIDYSRMIIDDTISFLSLFDNHWTKVVELIISDNIGISSDMSHALVMKRLQEISEEQNNEQYQKKSQRYLAILQKLESEMRQFALNPEMSNEDKFPYAMMLGILEDWEKSLIGSSSETWLAFYDMAFVYLVDKKQNTKASIRPDLEAKFFKEYITNTQDFAITELSRFILPITYLYWDGTSAQGMRFVEKARELYRKIYWNDPEKCKRLLKTFSAYMTEKKQANFYFLAVNPRSDSLQDVKKEDSSVIPGNVIFSLRFSPYQLWDGKNAEYVWAMNIHPDYQWAWLLMALHHALHERFSVSWNLPSEWKIGIITIDNPLEAWTIAELSHQLPEKPPIEKLYAHVVKWTPAARLWRSIGFEVTGKEESIEEDGKEIIREEICLTHEKYRQYLNRK